MRHRLDHLVHLGPAVVDHPERAPVLPARVADSRGLEGVEDLVLAHPGLRQRHDRTLGGLGLADRVELAEQVDQPVGGVLLVRAPSR